jgi:hypothetical protein
MRTLSVHHCIQHIYTSVKLSIEQLKHNNQNLHFMNDANPSALEALNEMQSEEIALFRTSLNDLVR